jgi:hypothetical protein
MKAWKQGLYDKGRLGLLSMTSYSPKNLVTWNLGTTIVLTLG